MKKDGPVAGRQNLNAIRFDGELLPEWAQLLDLAARLCRTPEETRKWFSRFTSSSGVADARTVLAECELLRTAIKEHQDAITAELQRAPGDTQVARIIAAWLYALDTMILQASARRTCSWFVEGLEQVPEDGSGGGDITLRRV